MAEDWFAANAPPGALPPGVQYAQVYHDAARTAGIPVESLAARYYDGSMTGLPHELSAALLAGQNQAAAAPASAAAAPPDMQGALEMAPGYQFRLGEGLKALERSAAARGTLLTGGTLKGLQRYAQDYASNEYQNRFNQLYSLANLGMGAAGSQANLGSQYANQIGNLYTGQGNVAAAGTIGAANAWGQGLTGAGNSLIQTYMLSKLLGGGAGTGG
jgi:hypothetical protein